MTLDNSIEVTENGGWEINNDNFLANEDNTTNEENIYTPQSEKTWQQTIQENQSQQLKDILWCWQISSTGSEQWDANNDELVNNTNQDIDKTPEKKLQHYNNMKEGYKQIWKMIKSFINNHKNSNRNDNNLTTREKIQKYEKNIQYNLVQWLTWDNSIQREINKHKRW